MFLIRHATNHDAEAILKIYKPFIENTAITFEYTVPSIEEFQLRITPIIEHYPYLVCEFNNEVIGYAYAHKFRERAAYDWDIETSVYVNDQFHQKGIATKLYEKLLEECILQGFHNAFAGITLPNIKSEKFHAKLGFTEIGVFKNAGFKQGAWHSVLFMERNLIPCDGVPEPVKPKNKGN